MGTISAGQCDMGPFVNAASAARIIPLPRAGASSTQGREYAQDIDNSMAETR